MRFASLCVLLALAPFATAQIVIGPYTFDDLAAPDVATPLAGSQPRFGGGSTACATAAVLPGLTLEQSVAAVMTDGDTSEWLLAHSVVQLDFTDNVIVNGPGADLVVFEAGGAENFSLAVFRDSICEWSAAQTLSVSNTGFTTDACAQVLNAREIDLGAFGILPGASVRRLKLDNLGSPSGSTGSDLTQLMALNSSEPSSDAPPCLISFGQDAQGYSGAVDTVIASDFPATNFSSAPLEYVDGSPERSLLVRFDDIVGSDTDQIPPGATVAQAFLTLSTGASPAGSAGTHSVHRLLQPWNPATITWASAFGGDGIDADGVEATAAVVGTVPMMGTNVTKSVDVTAAVQAWADGAPNHGLVVLTTSVDAIGLHLAEAAITTLRPTLSVALRGGLVFAEAVADFDPFINGMGQPYACNLDSEVALGPPDSPPGVGGVCCYDEPTYVSLGVGGSITLEFTSISISGDGSPEPDLWIYERGPDVEDTFVEVSEDGSSWHSLDKVFGAVSSVDLDEFGFGPLDLFRYVRLTDDPAEGATSGCTVGADIDAVAALAPNPWINLGASLPGQNGAPKLSAEGALVADGEFQLVIENALPNGSANFVVGNSTLGAPFKGGTMVPSLDLIVPGLGLDALGSLALPVLWPAGVPAGIDLILQVWIADAGGPKNFAATNALKTVTQ